MAKSWNDSNINRSIGPLRDAQKMADNAQLPLLGVILCCTSIPPEQRVRTHLILVLRHHAPRTAANANEQSKLSSIADQMGAVHKFDLTSDVTHLIVGDTDTPKYKFVAKERLDVRVMLPSWIEAARASWMEGGMTDVKALEVEHKLPTYHGLRVCVTGFEDRMYAISLVALPLY